ncbi:MAG: sigma-70 family RNA polymerase sigma factor [Deltaproteobacteria bacterium]|nr:sigma-70 family RNA polymerase sigma factor [Deltaproteobacteria bacterium]
MNNEGGRDPLLPLLQGVVKGDHNSFRQLYDVTNRRLSVYLWRMLPDREAVEDILAETYTQIWKNAARFEKRSRVLTWMIGISRNLALKELGKRRYHDDIQDHPEIEAPTESYEATNRREILSAILARLPVRQREILDLAFYQGLSYREISQLLSIPENTVKSRVFYAKAALKNELERVGISEKEL